MKSVSKFLCIVALGALATAAIAPAFGADDAKKEDKKKGKDKKKEKAPEPVKLSPSKEFLTVYQPVAAAFNKKTDEANAIKALESWPSIKAAMKNDDDRFQAGQFANIVGATAKNNAVRIEGLDLVVGSTRASATEKQSAYFTKGAIAYEGKDWVNADSNMTQAYNLGYRQPSREGGIESLIADAAYMQGKVAESLQWAQRSVDGSKIVGNAALTEAFYVKAANRALKTKEYTTIAQWMKALVRHTPKISYWHDALLQLERSMKPSPTETLDSMRLLRKLGGLGTVDDYAIYYESAGPGRLSQEVADTIQEGWSSGTLPKNNSGAMLANCNAERKLVDAFSSAELLSQLAGNQTGYEDILDSDLLMSSRDFAGAIKGYTTALSKPNRIAPKINVDYTDRALMGLAIAEVMLGDAASARTNFAKLTSPTYREIADYWLIHLDQSANPAVSAAPVVAEKIKLDCKKVLPD